MVDVDSTHLALLMEQAEKRLTAIQKVAAAWLRNQERQKNDYRDYRAGMQHGFEYALVNMLDRPVHEVRTWLEEGAKM